MTVLLALRAGGAAESSAREVAAERSLPVRSFSSLSEVPTTERLHVPSCLVAGIDAGDLHSQVVEHLRATRPTLSMVFVAPRLAPDALIALVRAGAVDVLVDPIDQERVKQAVREGLDRSRAIDELSAEEAGVMDRLSGLTHRETQDLDAQRHRADRSGAPRQLLKYRRQARIHGLPPVLDQLERQETL